MDAPHAPVCFHSRSYGAFKCIDALVHRAYFPRRVATQLVPAQPDGAAQRTLFEQSFVTFGRVSHVSRVLAAHPTYLETYLTTMSTVLHGDGPLPLPWRAFIGVMAAARHRCVYLVRRMQVRRRCGHRQGLRLSPTPPFTAVSSRAGHVPVCGWRPRVAAPRPGGRLAGPAQARRARRAECPSRPPAVACQRGAREGSSSRFGWLCRSDSSRRRRRWCCCATPMVVVP